MRRPDPPPLAAWILEHLASGYRDEALAGDLLEEFRYGRSDSWYWLQVVQACVLSWLRSLRARIPLLIFAFLWCLLAPAWYALCQQISNSPNVEHFIQTIQQTLGFFWLFAGLVLWLSLHAAFLWVGICLYGLFHSHLRDASFAVRLRRALAVAPLVFVPMYGLAFIFVNLYWFSYFSNAQLSAGTLNQIADLRLFADLIRVPYFFALCFSLWGAVARSRGVVKSLAVAGQDVQFSPESVSFESDSLPSPDVSRRFLVFVALAGVINAMIAGFILFQLPASHAPSIVSLLQRAAIYLVGSIAAGAMGSWLYWNNPASPFRERSPLPFSVFAMTCAVGWIWMPATVLFSEQVSGITAFTAMIGAYLISIGVRQIAAPVFAPFDEPALVLTDNVPLFSDSQLRTPFSLMGYFIALAIYGAGYALITKSNWTAALLLAFCAVLIASQRIISQRLVAHPDQAFRRAVVRLACYALPALLITAWALLDGVNHRNAMARAAAIAAAAPKPAPKLASTYGLGGYESIILWPVPPKKQIVAPVPERTELLAPGTKIPLVIHFDGAYWVLQPPETKPGKNAHQAHATPTAVEIRANNRIPLVMEAHQRLGGSVHIARCREIEVTIENGDHQPGSISLELSVSDSTSGRSLPLGEEPIVSSEPGHQRSTSGITRETLRFAVPVQARLTRFDEITIRMRSDERRDLVAPKVAIAEFELVPR